MKSKLLSTFSMLRVMIVAALAVCCVSCDKTETTDSTGFILYYMGVTDIGPGLSYELKAPAYKGSAPYDFTITKITLGEETFSNNENFVINAETGAISIQNTSAMASGLYSISVGCYSNGKFFEFKDAVQVNMLLAAPEGVAVEPAEVVVNQDEENWTEASAQVTTEQDKHISIKGYAIAQNEDRPYSQYFGVTDAGKIFIKEGTTEEQLVAGETYTLSLKLTTKMGDHMFDDAVTFKVVSKPRALVYDVTMPELTEVATEFNSAIPTLKGGKDDLKFAIRSVTPETAEFTIDEATGQIRLAEGHSLPGNDEVSYVFDITVSNAYGSNTFKEAYSVTVTNYITPIDPSTFSYPAMGNSVYQLGGKLTQATTGPVSGDKITFNLDDTNSDEVKAQFEAGALVIDKDNGTVTINDNHTFTAANHEIKVIATNPKTEKGGPAGYATLQIEVKKNPNDFEYVTWGTNMENKITINTGGNRNISINTQIDDKENEAKYRNQFRFIHGRDAQDLSVKHVENKNGNSSYTYEKVLDNFIGEEDIFNGLNVASNGDITFAKAKNGNLLVGKPGGKDPNNPTYSSAKGCIFQVKVTATSNDGAPAVSKKIPIFISTPKVSGITFTNVNDSELTYTILCNPFVVRVNPKTGKCSPFTTEMHVIAATERDGIQKNFSIQQGNYAQWTNNIIWDYRDDFSYCNFDDNTTHGTGDNTSPQNLLAQVWSNCGIKSATTNTPFRYYNHETGNVDINSNTKAAYIQPIGNGQYELVINGDVWKGSDNKFANGAVMGRMRFNLANTPKQLNSTGSKDNVTQYSLFIWFDETYEGN